MAIEAKTATGGAPATGLGMSGTLATRLGMSGTPATRLGMSGTLATRLGLSGAPMRAAAAIAQRGCVQKAQAAG